MTADDESGSRGDADSAAAAVPCSACRGTGHVISNLGGQPNVIECPWCDGGGVRLSEHDAQARRRGSGQTADRGTGDDGPGEPDGGGDQAA